MIELLALSLTGCILGVITGLIPGIHVNTICILGLAVYAMLGLTPLEFGVAMISMAVTHTFLDFIPAIFLGVPEEDSALSLLPAHKMFLAGKAYEAVKITGYGSLLGLFFALASIPLALTFIPKIYAVVRGRIVIVLIAAVLYLILRENTLAKKMWSSTNFMLAGWLGYLALNQAVIPETQILFPVFTGLFGVPTILASLKDRRVNVPQKEYAYVPVDKKFAVAGASGALGGMLVGVLPAMSPSQVGIILAEILGDSTKLFLVSVSAINTSDAIFSLLSLYTIGNPRSGVATMIGNIIEVDMTTLLTFIGAIAFVSPIALYLHLKIGKIMLKVIKKVDYRKLNLTVLGVIIILVYTITGAWGILYATVATAIGLIPITANISRTHNMGILLLPTILYYLM